MNIRIHIDTPAPPQGWVEVGGGHVTPFAGWLELLGVLSLLLGGEAGTKDDDGRP